MSNIAENENTDYKELFDVLPFFNFILSFLIVMHHSFNINVDFNADNNTLSWIIERFFYNLSECAVPGFFFVSSLLFYRNYNGTRKDYINKLRKRFFSIIIPYIIFNILGYAKHLLFSTDKFELCKFIRSIIISDTMPLWFLRELFILVMLAPIIFWLRKHLKLAMIIILSIVGGIALGIIKYRSFVYWFPIYFLGTLCKEKDILRITIKIQKNGLKYILFLVTCLTAWGLPNTIFQMDYIGNLIFYGFRLLSVLIAIYTLGMLMIKKPKVCWFMNYSFWVYCIHFPLISIVNMGFRRILPLEDKFCTIRYFVTVILVYGLAVIGGQIIKTSMPKVWNVLNGCRK